MVGVVKVDTFVDLAVAVIVDTIANFVPAVGGRALRGCAAVVLGVRLGVNDVELTIPSAAVDGGGRVVGVAE